MIISKFTKNQKTFSIVMLLVLAGTIASIVYASPEGHDTPVTEVRQSEQVVVRKVGDVDPDAISQEGLSSFYGEITSRDVASINASREGVISSWNVSVGDSVSVGSILGYVTVTGVSPEQQMALAEQQASALKAQLDLDTAKKMTENTSNTFQEISNRLKDVSDKQKSLYINSDGSTTTTTTYSTELKSLQDKDELNNKKVQDFAKTSLTEVYQMISRNNLSPLNNYDGSINYISLQTGIGERNSALVRDYTEFISDVYAKKARNNTATLNDIQSFFSQTIWILSASIISADLTQARLEKVTQRVTELQVDFGDLSNGVLETKAELVAKNREFAQINVDLIAKQAELDNDFSIIRLDQTFANDKAINEAKGAELLAQKLSVTVGGVIPIYASKSGILATVEKNVGDYVTVSDRVGFISTANPQKNVRFTIPASWKDINTGDTLSISWRAEYSMGSAIVTGISPIIDEKGGYQAEAVISSDTVFPVGASVRIIPENSKMGVFVNRKAVVFEGVQPYVWIVTESNVLRKQEVKIGRGLGEYVEILSGLSRGFSYLVILDPLVQIKPGMMLSEILKTETKVEASQPVIQDESQPHEH